MKSACEYFEEIMRIPRESGKEEKIIIQIWYVSQQTTSILIMMEYHFI